MGQSPASRFQFINIPRMNELAAFHALIAPAIKIHTSVVLGT